MDKPSAPPDPQAFGLMAEPSNQFLEAIEAIQKAEQADPELRRKRLRRNADENAVYARRRTGSEARREEKLLKDARLWAKAELSRIAAEGQDVFELREQVVQRTWNMFVPIPSDFSPGYEAFASALWEEGWPSLEDRAIVASAAAARNANATDTGIPMNLTPQQKELLFVIVDEHRSGNGEPFIFTHSFTSRGLAYPGGHSVPVSADELDFQVLEKAGLLAAVWLSATSLRGKPTQLGIETAASLRRSAASTSERAGESGGESGSAAGEDSARGEGADPEPRAATPSDAEKKVLELNTALIKTWMDNEGWLRNSNCPSAPSLRCETMGSITAPRQLPSWPT